MSEPLSGEVPETKISDEEIGAYYDRTQADWLREIPEEHQRFHRDKYIRAVRASPEAMRQFRAMLDGQNDLEAR